MQNIKILKKNVYELIAAGEVVTGPFSVVKELVENSIDAKASFISIEIKDGGKSLIRVCDNGIGIKNKQCKLAFLNHSTSKILNKDDLEKIKTLGFRGEALFSIACVSKVLITTKSKEEKLGAKYLIEGSKEKSFSLINCSNGTTIEVFNIFYNLPARLKFLKKASKEAALIENVLKKLAVSNPNVSFLFKRDGKKVLQTYGGLNKKEVLYNIFGKEFYENLIDLNYSNEHVKITGFVLTPEHFKSYKTVQYVFVNSRYVESKISVLAVKEAFLGLTTKGKFPCFVLYLTVPLKDVDVNIHPSKIEVKFLKETEIFNSICLAIKQAIFKKNNSFILEKTIENNFNAENLESENSFEFKSFVKDYSAKNLKENFNELKNYKYLSTAKINKKEKENNLTKEQKEMLSSIVFEEKKQTENLAVFKKDELKFNVSKLRVIGEIFKLYILAEFEENFIIIDKHAAHERILYEKLKKNTEKENLKRQILISPIKVLLNSFEEFELVFKNLNLFLKFGFLVENFEGNVVLIREIPLILTDENCKEVFLLMVFKLKNNKKNLTPQKLDEIYSLMACKGAIKKNQINSLKELTALAEKTFFNLNIRNCPHGRPVILVFNKERLDKKFARK